MRHLAILALCTLIACEPGPTETEIRITEHSSLVTRRTSGPVAEDDFYHCIETSASYQPHPGHATYDDDMADVARVTPGGFGGYFIRDGAAHVFLTDLSQVEAARLVLRAELGISSPTFHQGRYTWLELISCKRALRQDSMLWQTTHGGGISASSNRIVFTVSSPDKHEATVRAAIDRVDVPQEMVRVEQGYPLIPY